MSQVRDFSIRDSPSKDSEIEFQVSDANKMQTANQSIQKRPMADTQSQPMQAAAAAAVDDQVKDVGESPCVAKYRNYYEDLQACKLTQNELYCYFERAEREILSSSKNKSVKTKT